MRRWTTLTVLLTWTLWCTGAGAADPEWQRPPIREVPAGRTVTVDGAEIKCFTAPEWVRLGHIITDYRDLWQAAARWDAERASYVRAEAAWQLRLEAERDRAAALAADRDWWRTVAREQLELDAANRVVEFVPWIIAAGMTALVVVQSFR